MPTAVIADTDPSLREVFQQFLSQRGYIVHTAPDGHEALRLLRAEHPQVMLLEHHLPGMTGLDVLRYVQAHSPQVGVILIAEALDAATREAARALGAVACLEKPVAPPDLERCLVGRSPQDPRGAPRVSLPDRPLVQVPELRGVRLLDLSRMGARIEHLDEVPVGTSCTLTLPPPFPALSFLAHVVWTTMIERKHHPQGDPPRVARSGLRFAPLPGPQFAALADGLQRLAAASR